MKPYIEIINTQEYTNAYDVEYVVMGAEDLEEAEIIKVEKDVLLAWMNSDMPYDFYTANDITTENIKQYLNHALNL